MNVFILLAVPAFTAATKVFQHALIIPAKNGRASFVLLSNYISENKRFHHILIRAAEMNVFIYLAPKPAKNERVRVVALSVFFIEQHFNAFRLDPLKMSALILLAVPAFTAETKVFQHALMRPAKNGRARFVMFSNHMFRKQTVSTRFYQTR